jgi:hypothetical protein
MNIKGNQSAGLTSLSLSLVFSSLFFVLYQFAGHSPNAIHFATVFGKITIWVDFVAFLLAAVGVIWTEDELWLSYY